MLEKEVPFDNLTGKVLAKIDGSIGCDSMLLHCESGEIFKMYYEYD